LTISIELGLAEWSCFGQELQAHPYSLVWIRAGRAAITPQNKTISDIPQHKLTVKFWMSFTHYPQRRLKLIEWLIHPAVSGISKLVALSWIQSNGGCITPNWSN